MSRNDGAGRESRGDNVETSVQVTFDQGGYHVKPRIANYEQFDVAAKLSFPLPDSLDAGQIAPSATDEGGWQLADGELVLIEHVEWASTAERPCSIEAADRSQIESLVSGATVELADGDGEELAVQSAIQTEFPVPRSSSDGESASDLAEAESGTDGPGENDDDDRSADNVSFDESSAETGDADRPGDAGSVGERGDGGTEDQADRPDESGAVASGASANEPSGSDSMDSVHSTVTDRDGTRADGPPHTRESTQGSDAAMGEHESEIPAETGFLAGLPAIPSDDAADNTGPADADPSAFEWIDVEYADEASGAERTETDGVFSRLRSLFSE
jgi:hypothetical protein